MPKRITMPKEQLEQLTKDLKATPLKHALVSQLIVDQKKANTINVTVVGSRTNQIIGTCTGTN